MNSTRHAVLIVLLAAAFADGAALAQVAQGDYGAPDSDIRQTVARLAYMSGDVSFARGDDPDEWQPADANIPMTLGDRVWTAGGRLELQVHGGNVVRLANATDLAALNLTEDTQQFSLSAGVASFQIRRLGDDDVFEVDTPNAAITFERTGDYRVDVRENGDTRLQVRRGRAIVASGGGQVPLGAGDAILIEGQEPPQYEMIAVAAPDGWDRWVAERDARYASVRSYQYVSADIAGVEDLDRHGRWLQVPNYGWCWTPVSVAVGWQPYRVGRWIWQDPWGWTWVSTEPWGWAPYHYGRWVTWRSSWYWVPVAPRVAVVAYSPALVAFVGGGPGFSVSVGVGTDYIGWFPLAPRDPLIPWWGRPAVNVNVTHVTYVNRTYVTVVNQTTFVSSGVVTNNYVRDRSVVTRVERAPVVTGAIPIVPTRESIRVATRQAPAARPPASAVSRSVVTRVAPPAAPPRFDDKVAVIRENRGRPVTASEANRIVTRENRGSQPARAVRPATGESGGVTLAPKTDDGRAPKPEPVAPSRGRPLATREQPVAPAREAPARPQTREMPQAQEAPQSQERPPAQERSETREGPPAQARPPAPERPQSGERPPQESPQRESVDRRPSERPTARPVPADLKPPSASPDRSSDRPASAPPAQTSQRQHPAPRPTPREAPPAGAAAPRETDQPAAQVAPESRQAKPAPVAATPPERGRQRTTPKPVPTKKDDKQKDER